MNTPKPYLDRTDRAIVGLLQHDARLTNKEIASRVGIAQSTCSERIRRLERTGVFTGFHADVDLRLLGIGLQAMIAVRLQRHETSQVGRFREYAEGLPEVAAFYVCAISNDAGTVTSAPAEIVIANDPRNSGGRVTPDPSPFRGPFRPEDDRITGPPPRR